MRGQILGVRVAKDSIAEQCHVLAQLRFGIQAAARVIQVDMPLPIQARIFGGAQFVQFAG